MWGLWWTKRHWGRFSPSTSVSPANHHSTNFSIIIITRGWYNRPLGGRSAEWTQLDSTPTIQFKKLILGLLRGSVIGWGTMLQAGRLRVRFPMRSLDFSVDVILPARWDRIQAVSWDGSRRWLRRDGKEDFMCVAVLQWDWYNYCVEICCQDTTSEDLEP
jgi:hypothetical protein